MTTCFTYLGYSLIILAEALCCIFIFRISFNHTISLPLLNQLPGRTTSNAFPEKTFSYKSERLYNLTTLVRHIVSLDIATLPPLTTASNYLFITCFTGKAAPMRKDVLPILVRSFTKQCSKSIFSLSIDVKKGLSQKGQENYIHKETGSHRHFSFFSRHLERHCDLGEKWINITRGSSCGGLAEHFIACNTVTWNGETHYTPLVSEPTVVHMHALHGNCCLVIPATAELGRQCIERGTYLHWVCFKHSHVGTADRQCTEMPLLYELILLVIVSPQKLCRCWAAHPEKHVLAIGK